MGRRDDGSIAAEAGAIFEVGAALVKQLASIELMLRSIDDAIRARS